MERQNRNIYTGLSESAFFMNINTSNARPRFGKSGRGLWERASWRIQRGNMALPSSCRFFVAQGTCMKRMLCQGVRTVWISRLSDCKTHQQSSVTSPLRDFRRQRSIKLRRNAPYCNGEGGSEHTGYWFTVWSAVGKCSVPLCNTVSASLHTLHAR